MSLSEKQKGVLRGMLQGLVGAALVIVFGWLANPLGYTEALTLEQRLAVAIRASAWPVACLAVAIARLARHRFFTPRDIDGGGLRPGSHEATLLQALLQNTLEQTILALGVYIAWAVIMPASSLSVVPLAAMAFVLGRLLFFAGYRSGAPSRALGFTLCFYPSVGMLVCILAVEIWRVAR